MSRTSILFHKTTWSPPQQPLSESPGVEDVNLYSVTLSESSNYQTSRLDMSANGFRILQILSSHSEAAREVDTPL